MSEKPQTGTKLSPRAARIDASPLPFYASVALVDPRLNRKGKNATRARAHKAAGQ